jgi:hypothetical protein
MKLLNPSPRQLEYLDWRFGIFLHFGLRTFRRLRPRRAPGLTRGCSGADYATTILTQAGDGGC